ncbi:MAG: hypothetical protein NOU37_09330 [Candidatus Brocadiales bacterium]|nr:hypothetical protein [Candidatus Bathyanammoxibius amoris]
MGIKIIYRISDKAVVGTARGKQPVFVEMLNIVNSECGGVLSDYSWAEVANIPEGHKVVIVPDGTARTEVNMDAVDKRKEAKLDEWAPFIEAMEAKDSMVKGAFRDMVKERMP